jgi:small subunit ribosomal protein S18
MIRKTDRIRRPAHCPFCEFKTTPSFTDPARLKGYLTERGKIVSRSRSGVCLMHQRQLTVAIKRARFMALLPFVSMAR